MEKQQRVQKNFGAILESNFVAEAYTAGKAFGKVSAAIGKAL